MKCLNLIINVSLLITFGAGLTPKNSSGDEVNETIVNYKTLNVKTIDANEETALELRLADVV